MYDGGKLYILYNILADKFREAAFYKGSFIMYSENSFPMYYSFFTRIYLALCCYIFGQTENIFSLEPSLIFNLPTLGVTLSNELLWNEPVNLYLCSQI